MPTATALPIPGGVTAGRATERSYHRQKVPGCSFCRLCHAQHHLCAVLQLDISLVRHNVNAFGAVAQLESGQAKHSVGCGNNYSIGDTVLVTQKDWHGAHTVHGIAHLSLDGKLIE